MSSFFLHWKLSIYSSISSGVILPSSSRASLHSSSCHRFIIIIGLALYLFHFGTLCRVLVIYQRPFYFIIHTTHSKSSHIHIFFLQSLSLQLNIIITIAKSQAFSLIFLILICEHIPKTYLSSER